MKTKHVRRENLSKNASKNLTEGIGLWASFYRVIRPSYREIGNVIQI